MKYLVWGTGHRAEELFIANADKLGSYNVEIVGFVDNKADKKTFHGIRVFLPSEIELADYDYIDIWVIDGREEIERQIKQDLKIPESKVQNVFRKCLDQIMLNWEHSVAKEYKKPTLELLSICVDLYGAQQWYKYAFMNFSSRKHCYLAYKWISEHIGYEAEILEVACGAGGMLYQLHQDGFNNLTGYDVDCKAIKAANDITKISNGNIKFYIDDARNPRIAKRYDTVVWVNGMYHLSAYSLDAFFKTHLSMVKENGYIAFDMINKKYNEVPQNEYRTDCWSVSDVEKKPSEYKLRMSKEEVEEVASQYHLELIDYYDIESIVPHDVYIFRCEQKAERG